jgi:hypothetical protein
MLLSSRRGDDFGPGRPSVRSITPLPAVWLLATFISYRIKK